MLHTLQCLTDIIDNVSGVLESPPSENDRNAEPGNHVSAQCPAQLERTLLLQKLLKHAIIKLQHSSYKLRLAHLTIRRKRDRPHPKRVTFSRKARDFLENSFVGNKYPSSSERLKIAEKCNLSTTQVRVWVRPFHYFASVILTTSSVTGVTKKHCWKDVHDVEDMRCHFRDLDDQFLTTRNGTPRSSAN